jgi:AmiR/NasT family two-component response regulator
MVLPVDEDTLSDRDALDAALIEIANLGIALDHRSVIAAAVGMLMERYKLNYTAAFERLSRASQDRNVKLHALAAELVGTGGGADL